MKTASAVLLGFLCFALRQATGAEWGYDGANGVDHWEEDSPKCGGSRQSPINVRVRRTVYDDKLRDFNIVYTDFNQASVKSFAKNNGHSLVVTSASTITVNGGNLPGTYTAEQAHFHWGKTSATGSEHTVDGDAYPLEMHIVTYNSDKHADINSVLESDDSTGLAVLGVLFEISVRNNTHLQPLIEKIPDMLNMNSGAEVEGFFAANLLPGSLRSYYRYMGSLTTPTCNEVVVWTLFQQKNYVSEYQLRQLRLLLDSHQDSIDHNYRPVQDLNERTVSRSFQSPLYTIEDDGVFGDANSLSASLVSLLTAMALAYFMH